MLSKNASCHGWKTPHDMASHILNPCCEFNRFSLLPVLWSELQCFTCAVTLSPNGLNDLRAGGKPNTQRGIFVGPTWFRTNTPWMLCCSFITPSGNPPLISALHSNNLMEFLLTYFFHMAYLGIYLNGSNNNNNNKYLFSSTAGFPQVTFP